MATVTRMIGLSLGADICWPTCFEKILEQLALKLAIDGDTVEVACERVTIEPFDLRQPSRYDVVLDRLTHWYHPSREWIKKAIILDGLYVLNNPWAVQSMEKQTTYCAMMRLGMAVPDTWLLPPKAYEPLPDLEPTLSRYAQLFDLADVGERIGYPLFMKPYDGGGWVGVSRIADEAALRAAYDQSGKLVMHLQRAVDGYDAFVRCVGVGPQVRYVSYRPDAPLHDRYAMQRDFLADEQKATLRATTLTINSFFGWDFNSCEVLHKDGVFHPIDFANPCPDSQVTSLHYHFPWLVKALLRWAIYCAVTKRPYRPTLDWQRYFVVADRGGEQADKLARYGELSETHFDTARFEEFCARHLPHLDEVAAAFFASEDARAAVRAKVTALFPEHEIDSFTELFFSRIQTWREQEGEKGLDLT